MKTTILQTILTLALTTGALAQTADLDISQDDGGVEVPAGGTVVYSIDYANLGPDRAEGVQIVDVVPEQSRFDASASTPGWSCDAGGIGGDVCTLNLGALDAGASGSASFVVRLDPVAAGVLENVAVINSTVDDPDVTNNVAIEQTPVVGPGNRPNLGLGKMGDGSLPRAGNTVAYTLTVANNGNQGAAGVTITETVPDHSVFAPNHSTPGWACNPADGSAGASCTLDVGSLAGAGDATSALFAVTILDPLAAGVDAITNTASVTDDGSSGADLDPTDNVASATTLIDPATAPDLVLAKDDGGATVDAGDLLTYTLTASNLGDQDASGVGITETVPNHTTFDGSASTPGWSCSGGGLAGSGCSFPLGLLAGRGGSASLAFAVRVDATLPAGVDQIANTASISDDGLSGPDQDPSNNTASETTPVGTGGGGGGTAPDYIIAKDDGGIIVDPGDVVRYTLTYANGGNQGGTGVVLRETVPDHATFEATDSTADWQCDGIVVGSQCTFDLGTLAGGGDGGSVIFAVRVVDPLPAGVDRLFNTSSIEDDGANGPDMNPTNNTATDSTDLGTDGGNGAAPDLAITKTDGGALADPGMAIAYFLDVTNLGNQGATGVVITETVPDHTTLDAGASSPGWSCAGAGDAGDTCTFDAGTLMGGETASMLFVVTVDASLPAGVDAITNTATVADDGFNGPDQNPADNTATDMTALGSGAAPDLHIDITDGDATADAGSLVLYRIDFGNAGARGASGVRITALLPSAAGFDATGSSAGWSCSGVTCSIEQGTVMSTEAGSLDLVLAVADPLPVGVEALSVMVSINDDSANGSDLNPIDNTAEETTPIGGSSAPDLSLTKDDGEVVADAGDLLTYTLEWQNLGNRGASGVVVTEIVPDHTTFDPSSSDPGWQCAVGGGPGSVCTLDLGTINSGAPRGSAPFSVRLDSFLPAGVDRVVNRATIDDDGTNGLDPDPVNNLAVDETALGTGGGSGTAPDLALGLSDGGATAEPGSVVVYNASYVNNGNQGATGAAVSITVPRHTTFAPEASTPGWSCAPNRQAGSLCSLAVGGLDQGPAGGAAFFAVRVDAQVPGTVDTILVEGVITDDGLNGPDPNPADNFASDSTPLIETGEVDLWVDVEGAEGAIDAADRMTYTVRFANHGDRTAHGVRLRLSLPRELLVNTSNPGWHCRPAQTVPRTACVLNLGSVGGGEVGMEELAVRLDDPLPAGLVRLVTWAAITDDGTAGPDANPADNRDREITPVGTGPGGIGTAPDLVVEATDGDPDLRSGDLVTYTMIVRNEGNQAATGVQVAALLPPHTSHEPGDDTFGWTCEIDVAEREGEDGGVEFVEDELCLLDLGALEGGQEIEITLDALLDESLPAAVLDLVFLVAVEDDGLNGPDQNPDDNLAEEVTHIGPGGAKRLTITSLIIAMVQKLVGVFTGLAALLLEVVPPWVDWLVRLGSPGM